MPVPDMRYLTLTPEADYTSNPKQAVPSMLILQEEHQESSAIGWKPVHRSLPQQVAELIQSLNETVLTVLVP